MLAKGFGARHCLPRQTWASSVVVKTLEKVYPCPVVTKIVPQPYLGDPKGLVSHWLSSSYPLLEGFLKVFRRSAIKEGKMKKKSQVYDIFAY